MSSVRKVSSAAKTKSYELSGPFSGNRATTKNNVSGRSRTKESFSTNHDRAEEIGSLERILPFDQERGITKHVDITVMSTNDAIYGSSAR